jgi:hypothetical protein
MPEVILDEIYGLSGIKQVRRDGMTHEMHVTVGRSEIGESGVSAEEGLDLAFPESALATDK